MNIPLFDQTRKNEHTPYGESVRLSNELRTKLSTTIIDVRGNIINTPTKIGFNCETAQYVDFTSWLNNNTIKKSASLFWFVIRIMAWRFPEKHTEIRINLNVKRQLEFDLILSQMKKEIEWIGQVGYQQKVELNSKSSLNLKNIRTVKKRNGSFKIVRK